MPGIGVLFFLLLISSIPVIAVFVWFRISRYPFSLRLFSISLLIGATSFFPALFFQDIIPLTNLLGVFGRAFSEEFSRLLLFIILFAVIRRMNTSAQPEQSLPAEASATVSAKAGATAGATAGAVGLIAGLGFAILESAVYGASNPGSTLLRAFTAAPLHGACGFRVGSSVAIFRESPFRSCTRFLSAVIIHGIYNIMLILPGNLPTVTAVFVALTAFAAAIQAIRSSMKAD